MNKISARRLIDDCFLHDKDRLTHEEALSLLKERLSRVVGTHEVALGKAGGCTIAQDIIAPRNIPAFDNAAVDGYALAHESLEADTETRMRVSARIPAGMGAPVSLEPGTAVRIFTGAIIPQGADCVVMQEDVKTEQKDDETWVEFPVGIKPGINLRKAGEDQAEGQVIVSSDSFIRPFELAAIASAGIDQVSCYQPLKIALMSTGDEIVRPGAVLEGAQVYDSNHFMLAGLLDGLNVDVTDLGIIADDADKIRDTLLKASETHDLIISTGGASRGEEDHIVTTLHDHGVLHAWQLAIKPGRPLACGQLGDAVFLGLPGNPVAVGVCFLLYGRAICAALGGGVWPEPQRFVVKAGFDMDKKPLRREFLRGWLEQDDDGQIIAHKYQRDGSGLISSLIAARGFIELEEECTKVKKGDDIAFIPFSEFGISIP